MYCSPADVDAEGEASKLEAALPSSLMPEPRKGTKLGSATSGSEVLSAE